MESGAGGGYWWGSSCNNNTRVKTRTFSESQRNETSQITKPASG